MDLLAAEPRPGIDDPTHRLDQWPVLHRLLQPIALCAAWLFLSLAHPALTHLVMPQTATYRFHGPTPTLGVDQFGRAASFKIDISNAWSATSRLSWAFSFSNALICLAISGSIPPYFVRQGRTSAR